MNLRSSIGMVWFNGEIQLIDRFYQFLGIDVENGKLSFKEFELYYGDIDTESKGFQIVLEVDSFDRVEALIEEYGGTIVERGFGMSGPFLLVRDPAGINVRIGPTLDTLSATIKNSSKTGSE
jgi:hypothetical protein